VAGHPRPGRCRCWSHGFGTRAGYGCRLTGLPPRCAPGLVEEWRGLSSAGLAARSSGGPGRERQPTGPRRGNGQPRCGPSARRPRAQLPGRGRTWPNSRGEAVRRPLCRLLPRNAVSRAQSKTPTASRRCADSGARRARARPGSSEPGDDRGEPRMRRLRDRMQVLLSLERGGPAPDDSHRGETERSAEVRDRGGRCCDDGVRRAALCAQRALLRGPPIAISGGVPLRAGRCGRCVCRSATTVGWREGHRNAAGSADDPRRADGAWKAR